MTPNVAETAIEYERGGDSSESTALKGAKRKKHNLEQKLVARFGTGREPVDVSGVATGPHSCMKGLLMAEGTMQAIKDFFGSDGYLPVKNGELIELKKGDPEGFKKIRDGILDESFTY